MTTSTSITSDAKGLDRSSRTEPQWLKQWNTWIPCALRFHNTPKCCTDNHKSFARNLATASRLSFCSWIILDLCEKDGTSWDCWQCNTECSKDTETVCQIWGEIEGWVPDMSHHSVRICTRGSSGSNRRVTWCLIQSLPSSSSERLYRPAVDFSQLELTRFWLRPFVWWSIS